MINNLNDAVVDNSEFDMSIGCNSEPDAKSTPPNFVTQRKQREEAPSHSTHILNDQFSDFKAEMRKLMTYFTTTQSTELNNLNSTLREIQQTNRNIEDSVEYLKSQNEEFKQQISLLQTQAKEDRE